MHSICKPFAGIRVRSLKRKSVYRNIVPDPTLKMGCCTSSTSTPELRKQIQMKAVARHLDRLGAQRSEADALYAVFELSDGSKDGFLQAQELEKLMKLPGLPPSSDPSKSAFRKRIFSLFDKNGDGDISYGEFVNALFQYCAMTRYSLITFAFDLMDKDR